MQVPEAVRQIHLPALQPAHLLTAVLPTARRALHGGLLRVGLLLCFASPACHHDSSCPYLSLLAQRERSRGAQGHGSQRRGQGTHAGHPAALPCC